MKGSPLRSRLSERVRQYPSAHRKSYSAWTPGSLSDVHVYELPILRIEMPYYRGRQKTKHGNRILIELDKRTYVVEEAAKLLWEKEGFTVLPGVEVDLFISLFLVHTPWIGEDAAPFGDTLLNWIEHNGHSRKEAVQLRSQQRIYLKGEGTLLGQLLNGARELAEKYYIPTTIAREDENAMLDTGEIFLTMSFPKNKTLSPKEKAFSKRKNLFLKTVVGNFSKNA